MKTFDPTELREVLARLSSLKGGGIVVGGQAVNLWAMRYLFGDASAASLQPFTSKDLDILGSPRDAKQLAQSFGVRVTLGDIGLVGPTTGAFSLPTPGGERVRVDVLANVVGIGTMDAIHSAQWWRGSEGSMVGVEVRVLHPMLCLEGKLACLRQLHQGDRQDAKHVRMSIRVVWHLISDFVAQNETRQALRMIEDVGRLALGVDGLNAWQRAGIRVEDAVPIEEIARSPEPALQRFLSVRWPQLQRMIAEERQPLEEE